MSDAVKHTIASLPREIAAALDVNVVLVLGPTTPPPGKWNCRIAVLRSGSYFGVGRQIPKYATEATSDTPENAVELAFEQFRKDTNLP